MTKITDKKLSLDSMTRILPSIPVFVNIRETSMAFSKGAYELLKEPDGVELYVGNGMLAVKAGKDFMFGKVKPGNQDFHRICGQEIIKQVAEQIGTGRVYGEIQDGVIYFGELD